MGQSQEILNKNKELIDKMLYIQTQESPHYGQLHVYRLNQKPFDYYLKYREVHQNIPQSHIIVKRSQQLYEGVEGQRNIVKVDMMQIQKAVSLCSDAIVVECYARYHNYTLHNAINNQKKCRKMFKNGDLMYIFSSLTDAAQRISEHTDCNYMGIFKATKVFLSTEGFIKIYPFRICQQNMISQLNHSETEYSSGDRQQQSYYTSVTDLKDLAFLILQLCLLQHKQDLQMFTKQHIKYKLDQGLSGKISPRIRYLTIRLLEGEEMSWLTLRQELENIRIVENIRVSYCIRLEQDISLRASQMLEQGEQIKQMKYSRIQKAQRQQVLSSLKPNLVASRIQSFSRNKL